MRILITWLVHIIIIRWLLRNLRSRCRLICEIQPYIRPPTSSLTFCLIPKYNHGPMICSHILKTWKELSNRQKEESES